MKLRKIISLALTMAMLLTMMPFTVVAEDATDLTTNVTGLSGFGTAEDPFLINNLAELKWFRDKVDEQASDGSTQFAGKYFKLTADIDLAGINWNPIGSMTGDHCSFKGIFDGDNHTISNLTVEQAGNGLGLFAYTAGNAEIKNLTLNNVTVKSTDNSNNVGSVVGNAFANTKITNVHVTGNIDISGRGYIGGIVGHGFVVMDNVSVVGEGTIYSTFWCAGGILGYGGEGTTNITNATVEGTGKTGLTITSAAGGLGAIIGMAEDNKGTQPIAGANLSAKNVAIKTYVGAYGTAYSDYALGYLYGGNSTSILTGTNSVENVAFETSTGDTNPPVNDAVAKIGDAVYFTLAEAVAKAAYGDTVELLRDITLTEAVAIKDNSVLAGITLNGNGHTIYDAVAETSTLVFGDTNGSYWATGVTIKNLTVEATSDNANPYCAIRLVGGTSSTLTNVNVVGNYAYGINFYGTHGATLENCHIASAFTNGQSANPLNLTNGTVITTLIANDGADMNPKIFIDGTSSITTLYADEHTAMIDANSMARIGAIYEADTEEPMVAEVNGVMFGSLAGAASVIATDGTDTTIKILTDIEVSETIEFAYGAGNVIFTADTPVTIKQTATSSFKFTQNQSNKIIVGENVTFETYDNSSNFNVYYGPSLEVNGTITGGANWGALYLFNGTHTVSQTGKIGTGRVQMGYTTLTVTGEVDTNYLLVEKSTFTADGAAARANVIYDNNNGTQRWGASTFNIKNGSNVTTSALTLSYADTVLTIDTSSTLTATTITGAGKIRIDAANYVSGSASPITGNASTFTGTVEVINNDAVTAEIDENGNIILKEVTDGKTIDDGLVIVNAFSYTYPIVSFDTTENLYRVAMIAAMDSDVYTRWFNSTNYAYTLGFEITANGETKQISVERPYNNITIEGILYEKDEAYKHQFYQVVAFGTEYAGKDITIQAYMNLLDGTTVYSEPVTVSF